MPVWVKSAARGHECCQPRARRTARRCEVSSGVNVVSGRYECSHLAVRSWVPCRHDSRAGHRPEVRTRCPTERRKRPANVHRAAIRRNSYRINDWARAGYPRIPGRNVSGGEVDRGKTVTWDSARRASGGADVLKRAADIRDASTDGDRVDLTVGLRRRGRRRRHETTCVCKFRQGKDNESQESDCGAATAQGAFYAQRTLPLRVEQQIPPRTRSR